MRPEFESTSKCKGCLVIRFSQRSKILVGLLQEKKTLTYKELCFDSLRFCLVLFLVKIGVVDYHEGEDIWF